MDERRTIEELLVRYELEPDLRDVYVEGPRDQALLAWFFEASGVVDIAIYEIATVNVPAQLVLDKNLEDNNRGRVVAFACELDECSTRDLTSNVICVADSDFDNFLEQTHQCRLLILTDYSCMECYFFREEVVDKFLRLFVRLPLVASEVLGHLADTLKSLFLVRLANKISRLGLVNLPFQGFCRLTGSTIEFDQETYIDRYLNKNARQAEKDEFLALVQSLRERLPGEVRQSIHGHDFIDLMLWYVSAVRRPRRAYDPGLFERGIHACIELGQLRENYLFSELLRRFRISSQSIPNS
jgi:hypothetical protein